MCNFSLAGWNKISENVFLTHRWGLGIGHVTYGVGSCFSCICHWWLSQPPTWRFKFLYNVQFQKISILPHRRDHKFQGDIVRKTQKFKSIYKAYGTCISRGIETRDHRENIFWNYMILYRASDSVIRLICKHPHPPHNQSFFSHKTEKLCHNSIKAAALQPHKQKFWRDWLFWSSFSPKTATKTHQFVPDKFHVLASRHSNLLYMDVLHGRLFFIGYPRFTSLVIWVDRLFQRAAANRKYRCIPWQDNCTSGLQPANVRQGYEPRATDLLWLPLWLWRTFSLHYGYQVPLHGHP